MQYKILRTNDNNTATVEMTINDKVLVQDFDLGISQDELEATIKQGMAVFQSELNRNITPDYTPIVDTPVTIKELPVIPSEDLQPIDAAVLTASRQRV